MRTRNKENKYIEHMFYKSAILRLVKEERGGYERSGRGTERNCIKAVCSG